MAWLRRGSAAGADDRHLVRARGIVASASAGNDRNRQTQRAKGQYKNAFHEISVESIEGKSAIGVVASTLSLARSTRLAS
jgi:hypothetical protein